VLRSLIVYYCLSLILNKSTRELFSFCIEWRHCERRSLVKYICYPEWSETRRCFIAIAI